jgi:hypothetical protein
LKIAHVGPIDFGTNTSKRPNFKASTTASATCSVVELLNAGVSTNPVDSSVLTIPGMTTETSTPVPRSSIRTASDSPTTPCLAAQ